MSDAAAEEITNSDRPLCDLCGGTAFDLRCEPRRRFVSRSDDRSVEWHVCRDCGFVTRRTALTLAGAQANASSREYLPSNVRVAQEWREAESLLRELLPHLRPSDRIAEVGAGVGCVVKLLSLAGFDAYGWEKADGYVLYANHVLRAPLAPGGFDEWTSHGPWDVLLLRRQLTSVESPRTLLEAAKASLGEGGRIYLEVPNQLAHGRLDGRQTHQFTPHTLSLLARVTGFVTDWLSGPFDQQLRVVLQRAAIAPTATVQDVRAALVDLALPLPSRRYPIPRWLGSAWRAGTEMYERLYAHQRLAEILRCVEPAHDNNAAPRGRVCAA